MAKNSRVPDAVGAIPLVGDLLKTADNQAQFLQDMVEQNARLVGQFPTTMKNFNDALERFNQTVGRLDKVVSTIEAATERVLGPLEEVSAKLERVLTAVDLPSLRDIPARLDSLRAEALPALRAATDTQRQVAMLAATVERVITVLGEIPGASILRRITAGRGEDADTA
ncbi:MAG: hypothetical protein ABI232_11590 [Jatrophihabitantaceae bacterium]